MFFKKKNYKKILDRNKKLIYVMKLKQDNFSRFKTYKNYSNNIKKSVESFVSDAYSNNLLFFGFKVDLILEKLISKQYYESNSISFGDPSDYSLILFIEKFLKKIEFLEFIYLTKKNNNYYFLICIKGLLGYD